MGWSVPSRIDQDSSFPISVLCDVSYLIIFCQYTVICSTVDCIIVTCTLPVVSFMRLPKQTKSFQYLFRSLVAKGSLRAHWTIILIMGCSFSEKEDKLPVECFFPHYSRPYNFWVNLTSKSFSFANLQPSQLISECVNRTPTTRGATTSAFTVHASRTTSPTCSAATTTTPPSNTAATRLSSRWSCSSTSPPPQMVMHTSK